jgi:flavin reductase (DIM6/NTAB) family NADH-FMN oxidoreductase RutF
VDAAGYGVILSQIQKFSKTVRDSGDKEEQIMKQTHNVFSWLACPVVFICTRYEKERDIMTGTAMFVSEKEPLLVVSVAQGHLTEKLIETSGRFVAAIASEDQKKLASQLGSMRGDELDKYDHFRIETLDAEQTNGLVPAESAAWLQCKVENTQTILGYRVVTGRVEAQEDLNRPPLVWHQNSYFKLAPA